jgi:hypothetical protein
MRLPHLYLRLGPDLRPPLVRQARWISWCGKQLQSVTAGDLSRRGLPVRTGNISHFRTGAGYTSSASINFPALAVVPTALLGMISRHRTAHNFDQSGRIPSLGTRQKAGLALRILKMSCFGRHFAERRVWLDQSAADKRTIERLRSNVAQLNAGSTSLWPELERTVGKLSGSGRKPLIWSCSRPRSARRFLSSTG